MLIMVINNILRVFKGHHHTHRRLIFNDFYLDDSDIALSLVSFCSLIQSATDNIYCYTVALECETEPTRHVFLFFFSEGLKCVSLVYFSFFLI